jgi:tetratricopeptide (TPR) repeat protein
VAPGAAGRYFVLMEPSVEQLLQRGREALRRRDYKAALMDFQEVLGRHPDYADVHHLAGLCLSLVGEPEAALEAFDRALMVNPAYVEAHLSRAITLNEVQRHEDAQAAFERAVALEAAGSGRFGSSTSARLANAHAALGDLYVESGALVEGAAQYRAALELRPDFPDIRNRLARTLMDLGDLEGARTELEATLQGSPRFVAARLNLGLAHFKLGHAEVAAREWEQCLGLEPGNDRARVFLGMLTRDATAGDASG